MYQMINKVSELPKSCYDCSASHHCDEAWNGDGDYMTHRSPSCPLREVPEWTAEDAEYLAITIENWHYWSDGYNEDEPERIATMEAVAMLEKLCQLAGVEVKE